MGRYGRGTRRSKQADRIRAARAEHEAAMWRQQREIAAEARAARQSDARRAGGVERLTAVHVVGTDAVDVVGDVTMGADGGAVIAVVSGAIVVGVEWNGHGQAVHYDFDDIESAAQWLDAIGADQ